jgi:hypothetical protein
MKHGYNTATNTLTISFPHHPYLRDGWCLQCQSREIKGDSAFCSVCTQELQELLNKRVYVNQFYEK